MRSRRAWYFSNSWLVADCFRDRPYDFFFFFFFGPVCWFLFARSFFVLFVWFCPHSLSRLVFRSACEALLAIPGVFGCYLAVSRYFLFGLCGLACRLPARFVIILLVGRRGHPLLPCYHPVGLFVQLLSYFGSIRKLVLFFFFFFCCAPNDGRITASIDNSSCGHPPSYHRDGTVERNL